MGENGEERRGTRRRARGNEKVGGAARDAHCPLFHSPSFL